MDEDLSLLPEWEPWRRVFQASNPEESFSPNSRGVRLQSVIDFFGNPQLGGTVWELGKQAFDILTNEFGFLPTNEQLAEHLVALHHASVNFRELIAWFEKQPAANAALKSLRGVVKNDRKQSLVENFDDADVCWRMVTAIKILDAAGQTDLQVNRRGVLALCCLARLDHAVMAALLGDDGSSMGFFEEARECIDLIEQHKAAADAVKSARSAQGRKGAAIKHENEEALKKFAAKLYWERNWKSPRQAARALYPQMVEEARRIKHAFSEYNWPDTVYKWMLQISKNPPA